MQWIALSGLRVSDNEQKVHKNYVRIYCEFYCEHKKKRKSYAKPLEQVVFFNNKEYSKIKTIFISLIKNNLLLTVLVLHREIQHA